MKTMWCLPVLAALSLSAPAETAELPNAGVWTDRDGVMINAHGGALMKEGDVWYWYGEHKTPGKEGNKAWVGVGCYSSRDLLNWTNEGVAFKVATAEEAQADPKLADVEAGCILERPKVVKAQDGSRFVMYFHLEPKGRGYGGAMTGIAEAKTPTGPFALVWTGRPNAGVKPVNGREDDPLVARSPWGGRSKQWRTFLAGGQMSRDMTLYADPASGIVYHIFASEDNSCLHLAELRPDGLGYTGKWARLTPGEWTEAPAVVRHGDWYYLIGSGCTGWRPNAARYYRAKSVWGPWERMGNPCRGGEKPEITWGGQSTGIFEANGTAFAMFDVWRPSNAIDGRYVWVPIVFSGCGELTLDWRETFKPQLPAPWEDEYVSEVNRLPARTPLRPLDPQWTLGLDCSGRQRVTLPANWTDRRVTLRLGGYAGAVCVKVDGRTVGYGEDGRLPNEWDLTGCGSSFDLELEVLKSCDGTELEDEAAGRPDGPFRFAELVSEAKEGLFDFNVETRLSGTTGIVAVRTRGAKKPVFWRAYDYRGDELGRVSGDGELQIPNALLWSSAKPTLYRVRVECAGDVYEKRFGFRTVTVEDGVLKVNGEPVPSDRIAQGPEDPRGYDLCDEKGDLVIARANIGSRGSGRGTDALSRCPSWRKAFVERNLNQVSVLRDHPSVVAWSVGGGSETGDNLRAARAAVEAADPTRPVRCGETLSPHHP